MTIPSRNGASTNDELARAIGKLSNLFLIEGVVLVVLGALAVLVPVVATLAVAILLGWLFVISGIVGLATTLWVREAPGFWWSALSGVLAVVVGAILLGRPAEGVLSLTFVLIAFFLIEGIASIMFAIAHRREFTGRWGWILTSGVVTILLAGVILMGLPGTAAWALGLMVGIDMLFGGMALIAVASAARKAA